MIDLRIARRCLADALLNVLRADNWPEGLACSDNFHTTCFNHLDVSGSSGNDCKGSSQDMDYVIRKHV